MIVNSLTLPLRGFRFSNACATQSTSFRRCFREAIVLRELQDFSYTEMLL